MLLAVGSVIVLTISSEVGEFSSTTASVVFHQRSLGKVLGFVRVRDVDVICSSWGLVVVSSLLIREFRNLFLRTIGFVMNSTTLNNLSKTHKNGQIVHPKERFVEILIFLF